MASDIGFGGLKKDEGLIHELIPKISEAIGVVAKEQTFKGGGTTYCFRGIDQALNAVHKPLLDHGCHMTFEVMKMTHSEAERVSTYNGQQKTSHVYRTLLKLRVTFWAKDGSSTTCVSAGEGMDFGSDKATAKAMSNALKYALFFGLCLPVAKGDVDDSDSHFAQDEQFSGISPLKKFLDRVPLLKTKDQFKAFEADLKKASISPEERESVLSVAKGQYAKLGG